MCTDNDSPSFLQEFLISLTEEKFQSFADGLAVRKLEKPKRLRQEFGRYSAEIISKHYHFRRGRDCFCYAPCTFLHAVHSVISDMIWVNNGGTMDKHFYIFLFRILFLSSLECRKTKAHFIDLPKFIFTFFISAVVEVERLKEIKKEQVVHFYKVSLSNAVASSRKNLRLCF